MKDMKDTLRYKNKVANLKNRPAYVKEAELLREIAGGKQWRMDSVIEAISVQERGWAGINAARVLDQAAMFGRLATVEAICKKLGFDQDDKRPNAGMDAFHTAALHGHFRVADYLAENCAAHPDVASRHDIAPALPRVVKSGEYKKVDYLLRQGGDASWALLHAASNGDIAMAKHLISKGADVNSTEHDIFKAALQMGHGDMVKFLLKNGATPEKLETGVQSDILFYAMSQKSPEIMGILMQHGVRGHDGILLEAISRGNIEAAETLVIKGGLSIHGADGKERPLLAALVSDKPAEAFQFCLKHGADAEKALETLNNNPDLYKYGARATMEKRLNNYVNALRAQKADPKPPTP